jgi:hypothetical protein
MRDDAQEVGAERALRRIVGMGRPALDVGVVDGVVGFVLEAQETPGELDGGEVRLRELLFGEAARFRADYGR